MPSLSLSLPPSPFLRPLQVKWVPPCVGRGCVKLACLNKAAGQEGGKVISPQSYQVLTCRGGPQILTFLRYYLRYGMGVGERSARVG